MRKWVNLAVLGRGSVNPAEARESVLSVDVHGTRPTDTLSARPPEGKGGVNLILDFDQRVENLWGRSWRQRLFGMGETGAYHRPTLVQVDCVRLELGGSGGLIWILSSRIELESCVDE